MVWVGWGTTAEGKTLQAQDAVNGGLLVPEPVLQPDVEIDRIELGGGLDEELGIA